MVLSDNVYPLQYRDHKCVVVYLFRRKLLEGKGIAYSAHALDEFWYELWLENAMVACITLES